MHQIGSHVISPVLMFGEFSLKKKALKPPTLVPGKVHYWKLHSKGLNQSTIALPKTSLELTANALENMRLNSE